MDKEYVPPMRVPKRKIGGGIREYACPKCGGRTRDIPNGYECLKCGRRVVRKTARTTRVQRIWLWLNNKKTAIGGTITVIGLISSIWIGPLSKIITSLGGLIAAGGGIHKILKGVNGVKIKIGKDKKKWWEWIILVLVEIINQLSQKKGGKS